MSNSRCPVCASGRITPRTVVPAPTRLAYETNPQGGMFSKGTVVGNATHACACLDCGYVMCFLGPDDLARLRASAATLHPTA